MSLLLCGGVGLTAGAAPASATVTTLCKGYAACLKAGMSDSGYGAASKTMYWRMYAGHNCTNYVAYRMVRSGLPNARPWSGGGNATNWGTAMNLITDSTPTVGSVAWWKAGVKPAGSAGHVAYVEQVISADEIIVSQDSWGGDFSWARVTRATSGWPSGFVHFNDVDLRNTALPTITGTPKVGSVLTASPGSWSQQNTTFTYQWLQNGVAISGATAPTRKLYKGQLRKQITVQVTASRTGFPSATATSAPTEAVAAAVLSATEKPSITGDPRVGATLSADPGTWSPTPDSLQYQWRADGRPLTGATGSSLELPPATVGKSVSVTVTAGRAGYAPVEATSAETVPVAQGELMLPEPARVTGSARPGSTLSIGLPEVPADVSVAVQWLRDGSPVDGATGRSYRLTVEDLGTRVVAALRLTRPGYDELDTRTPSTPVVRAQPRLSLSTTSGRRSLTLRALLSASGVPAINGLLEVRRGRKLVAKVPIADGVATATLTNLPRGKRVFRFRVPSTSTLDFVAVQRRIRIR